jgi:hypothetical protein
MGTTTFSGPVVSNNGFYGTLISTIVTATTANVGTVNADTVTASGAANIIVIPTSDPGVTGAIWNNAGTLAVSA